MTKLKNFKKGLLGTVAIAVLSTGTAFADGTAANTLVSNTFTLDYDVNGAAQPTIDNNSNPTDFRVDRLVNLTVTSTSGPLTIAPAQEDVELTFTLTNNGNDTQSYDLFLVNTGDINSDNFDPLAPTTNTAISYVPVGGGSSVNFDGSFDRFPILAPDETITITVRQNIPAGGTAATADGTTGNVILGANTFTVGVFGPDGSATNADPVEVSADTDGNDLAESENVLLDVNGPADDLTLDALRDGAHSAVGGYIIAEADVTGVKTVSIFSEDGLGCATLPTALPLPATTNANYAIPGACVEYRITVTNNDTREATAIDVLDTLPDELTLIAVGAVGPTSFTDGTLTPATIPTDGTDCDNDACVVNLVDASLAADDGDTTNSNSPSGVIVIRALLK